jgi:hypothetical protein
MRGFSEVGVWVRGIRSYPLDVRRTTVERFTPPAGGHHIGQSRPSAGEVTMLATLVAVTTAENPGRKAATLARRFEKANDGLIAAIERCPDAAWRGDSRWSVAAGVWRLAGEYPALAGFIAAVATDRPLPPSKHDPLQGTDERYVEGCDKGGTLGLLRRNGAAAASTLRGLGDEQWERCTSCFGAKLSAAQLVDELLLAHVGEHRSAL